MVLVPTIAGAESSAQAIVVDRAIAYGVAPSEMLSLASCESSLNPDAIGDDGTSFGLYQLHDGGLLDDFYAEGYSDPLDPWQNADFAAAYVAEYGAGAWSCYWTQIRGEDPPWWG